MCEAECAAWSAAEQSILTEIMKVENVSRGEAIRRMQRRKAALGVRLKTDMPTARKIIGEEQLQELAGKFVRPAEALPTLSPERAASLERGRATMAARRAKRRRVSA